jgi:hypothetical protein
MEMRWLKMRIHSDIVASGLASGWTLVVIRKGVEVEEGMM